MGDSPDWQLQLAFQATQITNQTVNAGAALTDLIIAPYASLVLFEFAAPAATAGPVISQHTQAFDTGTVFAADSFYATAELTNNNGFLVVMLPALGNYLTVTNEHPTQQSRIVVYGLNSPALGIRRWLGYAQLPRTYAISNATAVANQTYSGAITDLPAGATVPNQMAFNGLTAFSGESTLAGTLFFWYLTPGNVLTAAAIGTVGAGVPFNLVGYFDGYARIVFAPSTNGNLFVGVNITAGAPQQ